MAIIYKINVKFFFPTSTRQPVIKPINVRFRSKLPRLLGSDGMAIGTTIFITDYPTKASLDLVSHELLHVWDYLARHTSILGDLFDYLIVWIKSGFSYTKHSEERFAYTEATRVVQGKSPYVFCQSITNRHLSGHTTFR